MKLHEMRSELDKLEQDIINAGGEITPEQESQMSALVPLTKDKLLNYGHRFLDVDKDVEALDVEIKRLQQRKKIIQGGKSWLLDRAKEAMERLNLDEIKSPLLTLKICKNPPSCEIISEDKIPASFLTIIPETTSIDKRAVLKALKEGEVKGARLITDKTRLKIS